jgi:tRNA(fMet)-specific endonuclease VapC
LLDTNICVRALRRKPEVLRVRFNLHQGQMAISTITLMELMRGATKSAWPAENRAEIELLLAPLTILDFDRRAATHAGEIYTELHDKRTVIGPYDILIAGHARSQGLMVITGNLGEFRRVDGLRCEDWIEA